MSHFVDTNIVVYSVVPGDKANRALDKLTGATISVQILNEFSNVALRKLDYDAETLEIQINAMTALAAAIMPIDLETHHIARDVTAKYRLNFYDSLVIASALIANCDTLYSEDMHHGMVIEGRLTIRNPFID